MRTSFFNRTTGTIAAALLLVGFAQPASAQDWRSQARAEINYLINNNPGSSIVYAGCRAVADDKYRQTGNLDTALGTLAGCASVGCVFTDSYSNCLSVGAQLFILETALS